MWKRLLTLSACAFAISCASAPSSDVPGTSQVEGPPTVVIHKTTLGFTICRDGEAESWIRDDYVDSPEVRAHEERHREQLARHPRGCMAAYGDMARRYMYEIEAFCAGIQAAADAGRWTVEKGVEDSAYDIYALYGFDRTHDEIEEDLTKACKNI